jgi:hypothetical protein
MIKCPNCGSTAQPKHQGGGTYSCGCGCWFTVIQKGNQEKESNQMTATYKGHPYD